LSSSSILFPYTTLFLSYYLMVSQVNKLSYPFSLLTLEQVVSVLSFALYKSTKIQEAEENDINRFFESLVNNQNDQTLSIKKHAEDRKSTRLNSSHVSIS